MDTDSNCESSLLRKKCTSDCCHVESNRKNVQRSKAVAVYNLFRFASTRDVCLIISAAFFAVLNGLCLPITIILYGDISAAFVSNAIQVKENVSAAHYCDDVLNNGTSQANVTNSFESNQTFMEAVIQFCVKTTFLHVTSTILSFVFVVTSNCAAENQIFRCRSACMKAVLQQEMGWYDTQKTDGLASRFSEDLMKMQDGIGEKLGMILSNLSTTFFCVLVAFFYGWELSLVTAIAFPILTFSTGILANVQMSFATEETAAYGDAGSLAEEIIAAIRTVTIFGSQHKEVRHFETALLPALKAGIKRGLASATGNAVMWLITYASYALSFWYGIELVLNSYCSDSGPHYDAASLNIVFFSMLFAAMKAGQILPLLEAVNIARVAAVNIYAIIDRSPLIKSSPKMNERTQVKGDIAFENVSFAYPSRPDVPILKGITFNVKAGQTVALVGASGCGKSTCLQLLQRFYDPERGRISIDGNDIMNCDLQWLRSQIGSVGQEPVLFGVSIGENIRYGHLDDRQVTQDDVERAAKLANAHSFIEKLPHGYNTMVGERGAQLSGGQKQRIAIARALVRRPKILLFDEATSALDNHSEAVVQKALDEARMGHTTLVVAHRLSTIKNADRILVFKDGVIEEDGNHESLMSTRGLYYQLVESQDMIFGETKLQTAKHVNGFVSKTESNGYADKQKTETNGLLEKKADQLHSINNNISTEDNAVIDQSNTAEVSIWQILGMNRPEFAHLFLGLIGSTLLGISTPLYSVVFGEVMGLLGQPERADIQQQVDFYVLMFLALAFVAGAGAFLQIFMFSYAGEHLTFRLRKLTFQSILHKRIEWFDKPDNSVGALCARLSNDASAIQGATGGRIGIFTQVNVSILFAFLLSFYYEWKLALACGVFVPIVLASTIVGMKINMGVNGSRTRALEQSATVAAEAISNIRTVVSLGREKTFHGNYMRSLTEPYKLAKRKSYVRGLVFGFTSNASSFASIVCMGYGGYLVQNENLDYKYVFIICEALIFGMEMIGQTIAFTPDYGKTKAAANRIFSLIGNNSDTAGKSDLPQTAMGEVHGLHLDEIYFSYPTRRDVQVLNGLAASIQPGQTVALVGPSGCGKSTCIQLVQRFYDPDKGHVHLDGQSVKSLDVASYRSHLGVVSQEPCLFNRTIAENIAYGDQSRQVNMDEVIEVAKKANIHSFVQSLPLGYETNVGQRGTQLSGGQKQRIAIARMLIRNPKILILDEATSALDAGSEHAVQEALDKASRGRTCIVIAHRLSTIVNADIILVVHHGRIHEEGTHDELISRRGMYYHLWTLQGFGDN